MEGPGHDLGPFLLFDQIEASAVDHPELARDVGLGRRVLGRVEGLFHPVEKVGLPDPHDPGDGVAPPKEKAGPFVQVAH